MHVGPAPSPTTSHVSRVQAHICMIRAAQSQAQSREQRRHIAAIPSPWLRDVDDEMIVRLSKLKTCRKFESSGKPHVGALIVVDWALVARRVVDGYNTLITVSPPHVHW
jgi:hypothetical protein